MKKAPATPRAPTRPATGLQCELRQQRVEADAGERRQRRHDENEMPHSGKGRAVADHLASTGNRAMNASMEISRWRALRSEPSPPRRPGDREQGDECARQDRQRQLDREISGNIPTRNLAHFVQMAEGKGLDPVMEVGEGNDRANGIERLEPGPRPGGDHDDIGEHDSGQRAQHRACDKMRPRGQVATSVSRSSTNSPA